MNAHPLFSECDSDLRSVKWQLTHKGYARTHLSKCGVKYNLVAHRAVMARVLGRTLLKTEICDHINGNRLDNRRENLRLTDAAGNSQNRMCSPTRGVIQQPSGRYTGVVRYKDKQHYCGTFDTREAAAAAAKLKRIKLGFLGEPSCT